MNKLLKLYWLVFVIPLDLLSCNAPQGNSTLAPTPSVILSTVTPVPLAVNNTPAPQLIPKHHDLIFVEFFAVT